jgi:hypothetical protein
MPTNGSYQNIVSMLRLTHRCPDDGVAEVTFRSIAVAEACHSDAVRRSDAQM